MNKQKLSKLTRNNLASLFNEIQVSEIMMKDDNCTYSLWREKWGSAIIKLSEDYGVNLPNLELARSELK